jgi:hypothetical protein
MRQQTVFKGRSEKEKMMSGELYIRQSHKFQNDHEKCREAWNRFNIDDLNERWGVP